MKKYLIYITIIFAALINSHNLFAIEAVTMTCTQVNPNGSVIIYWENPGDMTGFQEFRVYREPETTPIMTSNNENLLSFHDDMVNANLSMETYLVEIVYESGSIASFPIKTIYLQLDTSVDGTATLLWNPVQTPLPDGSSNFHKVYKSVYVDAPNPNWVLIRDDVSNTLYNYIVEDGLCHDSINFKIEMVNSNGCTSVSNVKGDWFSETNLPDVPIFDYVSINDESFPIIGWQASASNDVDKYVIYDIFEDETANEFDTVNGLFYIDYRNTACEEIRRYDIASLDRCGNIGLRVQRPQGTILLNDIGFNVCAQQDTLVWEKYLNSEPPLEHYLVWRNQNAAGFIVVDTVDAIPAPNPPLGIDTTQMWYIDQGIDPGSDYEYFVQAVFGNNTSSSCKKTVESYSYEVPQHIYFANADVLPTNEIELLVDVDTSVFSCTWELHRYDPINTIDDAFSSTTKSELSNFPLNIVDDNVEPQNTFYEYYALVYDSCGIQRLGSSNTLKTIHLTGTKPDEPTNRIEWTAFDGWETEVEEYFIYRLSGNESSFSLLHSVDGQILTYDDIIDPEQAAEGKFSYFVEAKQTAGGTYDYQAYSRSNIFDLFFDSEVFFPNAFRPGGINYEFKPIFTYFSGSDYLFQIYNRWGQIIFETNDPEEGWDGTADGKTLSSGLFVYRLTYKNIHGIGIEKKGTVMLVK